MQKKIAVSATALVALMLTGCNAEDDNTECDTIVTSTVSVPTPRPAPAPRAPSVPKPKAPNVKPQTPNGPRVHTICHERETD